MEVEPTVYQVFTPATPANLTFIERDEINNNLVNALRTPGKQIVIYGHSGSGKSTLINKKLERLYESHVISRCMQGMSFDQLVLDAFDQLSPFFTTEKTARNSDSVGVQLNATYLGIKNQISGLGLRERSDKSIRLLPPQLTLQNLARFMGQAKSCWILEDFHKINEGDRALLSQAMKVFVDMAGEYNTLKIIAIGAVDSARQVVKYDNEMRTRVAEIHVPLMNVHELQDIIIKGAELMNLRFDSSLSSTISHYAAGLPSICHTLCLNICVHLDFNTPRKELVVIKKESLQPALKMYLDEASDTLKMAFENNLKQSKVKKYNNAELIVKALSELPQEGGTRADIFKRIAKYESDYPQGNLTKYLKQMCETETTPLIRSSENSGKYAFIDPLYRAFAMVLVSSSDSQDPHELIDWNDVIANFIKNFSTEELTKSIHTHKINYMHKN
ncbi:ATP-binding protein [Pseudomonas atacamensis]|jgi:energy-coupling factor transporter ATP-binding protein EcfA2|uniref:ATP-binding protein n=1 Tax=Pseudomonas atacamensis TaxID=2565368 RepID=UPI0019D1DA60|nr:ATP-binding protein [Pseudomonas atacamensis]QSL85638.1 ATP-binding protein [Pseudomonas atacamensis]